MRKEKNDMVLEQEVLQFNAPDRKTLFVCSRQLGKSARSLAQLQLVKSNNVIPSTLRIKPPKVHTSVAASTVTLQAEASRLCAAAEASLFDAVISHAQATTEGIKTDVNARISEIARKLNTFCSEKKTLYSDTSAAVSAISKSQHEYMQHVRFTSARFETHPSEPSLLPAFIAPPEADSEEIEFQLIDPALVAELDRVAAESTAAATAAAILSATPPASAAPAVPLAPAALREITPRNYTQPQRPSVPARNNTQPQRPSVPAVRPDGDITAAATPRGQHRARTAATPVNSTPSGPSDTARTTTATAAAVAACLDAAAVTIRVPVTGRPNTSQTPAAATADNMPATPSQADVNMQLINMLNTLQRKVEQIDTQQQQQQVQQQQQSAADTPNGSHNRSRLPHSGRATSSNRQQQSGRQLTLETRTGLSPDGNGPDRRTPAAAARYNPYNIPLMGPFQQHPPLRPPPGYGGQHY